MNTKVKSLCWFQSEDWILTAQAFRGTYVVTQYGNQFSVDWCLGNAVFNIKDGIESQASAQKLAEADYQHQVNQAISPEENLAKETNHNICEFCDEKPHTLSFDVADTAICSKCNANTECWDKDLIGLYHALNISDDHIDQYLPRLRHSGHRSPAVSLSDIGKAISEYYKSQSNQ